jgi:hypothetical protein
MHGSTNPLGNHCNPKDKLTVGYPHNALSPANGRIHEVSASKCNLQRCSQTVHACVVSKKWKCPNPSAPSVASTQAGEQHTSADLHCLHEVTPRGGQPRQQQQLIADRSNQTDAIFSAARRQCMHVVVENACGSSVIPCATCSLQGGRLSHKQVSITHQLICTVDMWWH